MRWAMALSSLTYVSVRYLFYIFPEIFELKNLKWKNNVSSNLSISASLMNHLNTRLWQVLSQGYGQSMALMPDLSKYQSPTDSAIPCKLFYELWMVSIQERVIWSCWVLRVLQVHALFRTRGELRPNQVSGLSVWQWAKHEFMKSPFL